MQEYNVTVNGKTYNVLVEKVGTPSADTAPAGPAAPPAPPHAAAAPLAPAQAAAPRPKAAKAPAAPAPVPAEGETTVNSPMPGNVYSVNCEAGQSVAAGTVLVVLEAMKMEVEVPAPVAGTVKTIHVGKGDIVNTDQPLVTLG